MDGGGTAVHMNLLQQLKTAGVEFTVHMGDGHITLTPDQVLEFAKDPDLYRANYYGISKDQFREWRNWLHGDYETQCKYVKKDETRCRNAFDTGLMDLHDPAAFANHPKLCRSHIEHC